MAHGSEAIAPLTSVVIGNERIATESDKRSVAKDLRRAVVGCPGGVISIDPVDRLVEESADGIANDDLPPDLEVGEGDERTDQADDLLARERVGRLRRDPDHFG